MTKRVKSSRAFASMVMGKRMRPESTMPLTADRLRPNPVASSFSTRMGTGNSNLMITLSGAGSSRSGSRDRMSGFQLPCAAPVELVCSFTGQRPVHCQILHHGRIVILEHQQPLALQGLHIDALGEWDFRHAAAQLAADQHPDVEELAVRVHAELPCGTVTRGPARHACFDDGGRPSSLITHSAFRPISHPPPSAGTPILRKSFMASRISRLTKEVPGSTLRRRELPAGSVAYGQRLKVDRAGWRDAAHHVASRKPALITRRGLRAARP